MRDYALVRDTSETGPCRKTIMLVDASLRPSKNNRGAKQGTGNQTFASAVLGFNPRTKQLNTGDGTGSVLVRFPFEPDNWIHREHASTDLVWAVRLTVDKTNKAQELKNRSTHVIDQSEDQLYGNFADLFWICKTGVDTDFQVSGAGYASDGGGLRDALALSCAENEGFISDGDKFGQLAHVFTFLEPEKPDVPTPERPTVTTPGIGGPTIATTGNTNGLAAQNPGGSGEVPIPNSPGGSGEIPVPNPANGPEIGPGIKIGPVDPFAPR